MFTNTEVETYLRSVKQAFFVFSNVIIPNETPVRDQELWPVASWFLVPQQLPSWQLCDFSVGMGTCFYPMTLGNEGHWVLGNQT